VVSALRSDSAVRQLCVTALCECRLEKSVALQLITDILLLFFFLNYNNVRSGGMSFSAR